MTKFDESRGKVMELVDDIFMLGIEAGFNHGVEVCKQKDYKRGYDAGLDKIQERVDDAYGVGYRHGLDDAWECARKLAEYNDETFREVIGDKYLYLGTVFTNETASEAIAKIKEYEEKQTEKSCENCECFGNLTECKKRPCYAHSCWTPKRTADKIKAEYDEETRSYSYTVKGEAE